MGWEDWQAQSLTHDSACHLEAYDLGGDGKVLANFKHGCSRLIWNL